MCMFLLSEPDTKKGFIYTRKNIYCIVYFFITFALREAINLRSVKKQAPINTESDINTILHSKYCNRNKLYKIKLTRLPTKLAFTQLYKLYHSCASVKMSLSQGEMRTVVLHEQQSFQDEICLKAITQQEATTANLLRSTPHKTRG